MNTPLQKTNIRITMLLWSITVALWLKAVIDIASFRRYNTAYLSVLMSGGLLLYFIYGFKQIRSLFISSEKQIVPVISKWIWIFIPLSVVFTSPVCYRHTIFISPYLASTIIRLTLLFLPFILFISRTINKDKGIFILNIFAVLSLFPNDKCKNPFNYSWIELFGASPLTYLPTIVTILFYSFYCYGTISKRSTIMTLALVCLGALTIALGHRTHILW